LSFDVIESTTSSRGISSLRIEDITILSTSNRPENSEYLYFPNEFEIHGQKTFRIAELRGNDVVANCRDGMTVHTRTNPEVSRLISGKFFGTKLYFGWHP
jgi:hypothetical protein